MVTEDGITSKAASTMYINVHEFMDSSDCGGEGKMLKIYPSFNLKYDGFLL